MASILDDNLRIDSPTNNVRLEWKSTKQAFCFYQKPKTESEEGKTIALENISFIPIYTACRIGGYNEKEKSYIFSNTVEDSRTKELTVKFSSTKAVIAKGIYKEIKDAIVAKDGEYQVVLYSLLVAANGKPISPARRVEVIIAGSSSQGMTESNVNTFNCVGKMVQVNGTFQLKKGAVNYNAPKFSAVTIELPIDAKPFAQEVRAFLGQWDNEKPIEMAKVQESEDFTAELSKPIQYPIAAPPPTPSVFNGEETNFPTLADEPPPIEEDLPF